MKFYIKPAGGEEIEAAVTLPDEKRAVARGVVRRENGQAVENACVLLYDTLGKNDGAEYKLVGTAFSDSDGVFLLGPLERDTVYAVYVTKNETDSREIKL